MTTAAILRARIASRVEETSVASPWYALPPDTLPADVAAALSRAGLSMLSGIIDAIARYAHGLQRPLWYVVRAHQDGKWYAVRAFGPGPAQVMSTGDGKRNRWFRTRDNCRATVDYIENARQPDDPRW